MGLRGTCEAVRARHMCQAVRPGLGPGFCRQCILLCVSRAGSPGLRVSCSTPWFLRCRQYILSCGSWAVFVRPLVLGQYPGVYCMCQAVRCMASPYGATSQNVKRKCGPHLGKRGYRKYVMLPNRVLYTILRRVLTWARRGWWRVLDATQRMRCSMSGSTTAGPHLTAPSLLWRQERRSLHGEEGITILWTRKSLQASQRTQYERPKECAG